MRALKLKFVLVAAITLFALQTAAAPEPKGYIIPKENEQNVAKYFDELVKSAKINATAEELSLGGGFIKARFDSKGKNAGAVVVYRAKNAPGFAALAGDLAFASDAANPLDKKSFDALVAAAKKAPFPFFKGIDEEVVSDPSAELKKVVKNLILAGANEQAESLLKIMAATGTPQKELEPLAILLQAASGRADAIAAKFKAPRGDDPNYNPELLSAYAVALMAAGKFQEAANSAAGQQLCQIYLDAAKLLNNLKFKERIVSLLEFAAANRLECDSACVPTGDCPALDGELGVAYADFGRVDEGVKLMLLSFNENPRDEKVFIQLVTSLKTLGRNKEAAEVVEKGYDSGAFENNHLLTMYATIAAYVNDLPWMVERLKKRLEKNPNDKLANVAMLVAHYYAGKYEEAEKLSAKALEAAPDSDRVRIYAAMSRFQFGKIQEAKTWLYSIKEHPQFDSDVYFCRALVEYADGNQAAAVANMEKYVSYPVDKGEYLPKPIIARKMLQQMKEGKELTDFVPLFIQKERAKKYYIGGVLFSAAFILLIILRKMLRGRKAKTLLAVAASLLAANAAANAAANDEPSGLSLIKNECRKGVEINNSGYSFTSVEQTNDRIAFLFSNGAGDSLKINIISKTDAAPSYAKSANFNIYYETPKVGRIDDKAAALLDYIVEIVSSNDDGKIKLAPFAPPEKNKDEGKTASGSAPPKNAYEAGAKIPNIAMKSEVTLAYFFTLPQFWGCLFSPQSVSLN